MNEGDSSMALKLLSNEIVDQMVYARAISHPGEKWTRDVPMIVQRRLFPNVTGIAHESDAGRGAVAMDLYGLVPFGKNGDLIDEVTISVKSTRGKGRKHGRTAILTAGTKTHVENIVEALRSGKVDYPVVFVHLNTTTGQWVQTFFDAGRVLREVSKVKQYAGNSGLLGISFSNGERGVPITMRETARKGTDRMYFQLNFNMGVLVTPKGHNVPRSPGVYGLGLATPWREVDAPEIEWDG
jgi:hypothetical protein